MLNDTSPKTFDESDLINVQNLDFIQMKKSELKQDIYDLEINNLSIISITHIQETSKDIMKMSDDDILSLIEKTL